MKYMMRKLIEEYEKWDLIVNIQKTKYLCIGAETKNLIMEGNKKIETWKEYEYLGTTLKKG